MFDRRLKSPFLSVEQSAWFEVGCSFSHEEMNTTILVVNKTENRRFLHEKCSFSSKEE